MYQPENVPSEAEIRRFIRHILFGKNLSCPGCKCKDILSYETRYRCRRCRSKFSLLSHTWLSNLKISLRQFWVILWCFAEQIPIRQATAVASLSTKAVRAWYQTFRNNLPREKVVLEAIIQLDEVYFSGFKGRSILMAKQKGTRKLAYQVLSHTQPSRLDALEFLRQYVKPGTMICTDGFTIYDQIERWYPVKHVVDIHKAWEYSKTSEIEGVFGNLRTFIRRMYHHVTPKNLPEIVGEFCCRFSHPEIFKSPRIFLQKTLYLVPTGY